MKINSSQGFVQYIGIGLQLAVTVLLGLFAGYAIDRKFMTIPWFTLIGAGLGLVFAFVNLIAKFRKNKDFNEFQ